MKIELKYVEQREIFETIVLRSNLKSITMILNAELTTSTICNYSNIQP